MLFLNLFCSSIRDLFSKFGHVVAAEVMKDRDGKSRGFGFVQFARKEDAKAAHDADSLDLDGRTVSSFRV